MSRTSAKRRTKRDHELTNDEVKAIITQAMVEAEAKPEAVYAYYKTGCCEASIGLFSSYLCGRSPKG
jgi:hypothetical protein